MVSFAKEPYQRDDILQERPIILGSLHNTHLHVRNNDSDATPMTSESLASTQNNMYI